MKEFDPIKYQSSGTWEKIKICKKIGSSPKRVDKFSVSTQSLINQWIKFLPCQGKRQRQAGGRRHRAKQKSFGTLPAQAPSLAILTSVPKSPNFNWGAFRPSLQVGEGVVGWKGSFYFPPILLGPRISNPISVWAYTSEPSDADIPHRAIHRLAFAEPESYYSIPRQNHCSVAR